MTSKSECSTQALDLHLLVERQCGAEQRAWAREGPMRAQSCSALTAVGFISPHSDSIWTPAQPLIHKRDDDTCFSGSLATSVSSAAPTFSIITTLSILSRNQRQSEVLESRSFSSCSLLCTLLAQAQYRYSFTFSPPVLLWLLKISTFHTRQPTISSVDPVH